MSQKASSPNWFKIHLNLTLLFFTAVTYLLTMVTFASAETTEQGHSVLGLLIQLFNPALSNQTESWFCLLIWLALMLPVEGWVLRKKNRSMWHLLWAITPFGWIIILWFDSPKIDGNELQECLTYFEAETKILTFQTKEADLYNNVMVKYSNSITVNPLAAIEARKAAKRLSQAATEVLRRHEEIKNVTAAASTTHHAWYVAFYAYIAWAHASATAIEALVEGMNPDMMYIQQLVKEQKKPCVVQKMRLRNS